MPFHSQVLQFFLCCKLRIHNNIFEILREPKANQQEKISFRVEDLRKFFPKTYSVARIQERILKLLEADCRKRQRSQER